MKCLLCELNEADQTGAHIFPAWMVASAFDTEGRTRGHEVIYTITPFDAPLPFIGRSINETDVINQLGRGLQENEIDEMRNPIIVDNLWCRSCERKFTTAEEYFLEFVHRKIIQNLPDDQITVEPISNANNYLIRLFFYSLLFRAHISKGLNFNLTLKTLNRIKNFLNYYLKETRHETLILINSSYRKDQIAKYPLRCLKIVNIEPPSGWVYLSDVHFKPYCLIINDYIIQFYGKGNQASFKPSSFFGICDIIRESVNVKNYKEDIFKLGIIGVSKFQIIRTNYANALTRIRIKNYASMFSLMFKFMYKHLPSPNLVTIFLKELVTEENPLGLRYTKKMIVDAFNRTIDKANQSIRKD